MNIKSVKTRIFKKSESLALFVKEHIATLKEGSVLVVSSKIAALAGGLAVPCKNKKDFEKLVKKESDICIKTDLCFFTIRSGMVMTNAGVDESNAGGEAILLPADCYASADALRRELRKIYKVRKLGVIITDSMILPLRAGVIGAAVGYAGFKGVKNYIGKKDIYGRKLKTTMVDIADTLAASASLLMGEADEKTPLAVIENAPVTFTNKTDPDEIKYPLKQDLYYPFLKTVLKKKK
ncbi:coenzyme F420-0:L-glutamate ligase [Parelusimicrobium proximum]|uniref:coenzyme F420-0:L-glutamate ligase n=1 Tax=Parelusimicrobium proximum TaxID=3228953 RepID=UPI003D1738EF